MFPITSPAHAELQDICSCWYFHFHDFWNIKLIRAQYASSIIFIKTWRVTKRNQALQPVYSHQFYVHLIFLFSPLYHQPPQILLITYFLEETYNG